MKTIKKLKILENMLGFDSGLYDYRVSQTDTGTIVIEKGGIVLELQPWGESLDKQELWKYVIPANRKVDDYNNENFYRSHVATLNSDFIATFF